MAQARRHMGLRMRFTLLVTALLFVMFVVIAYILVVNAQNNDTRNINQDSKALATLATPQIGNTYDIYKDSGSIKIKQKIQTYTALDSNIVNVAIVGLNGKVVYQTNSHVSIGGYDPSNSFQTQYMYQRNGLMSQIVVPYFNTYGQHPYSIAYLVNKSVLSADTQRQIKEIITFSLIGLVVTAVIMYELTTRLFIKPVEKMSRQAIFISQGNYDASVDVTRRDEIGKLADSVNTMSQRLKADIVALREVDKLKTEFITIASHNLRTPLTIIQGSVEALHAKDVPEDIAEPLKGIEASSSELASFAEDMLTISTIEAGETYVNKEPITIESLIVPIRERFTGMATEKGVNLVWQTPVPEASVNVAANYTRAILRSLLDNAIKFTSKGGTVTCRAVIDNLALKLTVSDTGTGISPEEQDKLFTKFHRGTSAMEYNYRGTGIGLYASKLMAEAQHGGIQVVSEPGKGSTFTVIIPQ